MKGFCLLAAVCGCALFGQNLKWWVYDVPEQATTCRILMTATDLYKELQTDRVTDPDLKAKFPNIGWKSGKVAATIMANPKEGDLVTNSLSYADGNVNFRLVRNPRLTKAGSRAFVVEVDRRKLAANATCKWSVDAPSKTRTTIIRQ